MAGIKQATVTLSREDIDHISRVVQTEVDHGLAKRDPKEYARQVKGVTDTILNRVASGYFPNSVKDVVDQRMQFSAINGPKTYVDSNGVRRNTGSVGTVEKAAEASPIVRGLVTDWVASRASGVPSIIGENLNYANPGASSANNAGWIQEMIDQPGSQTFGRPGFQHVHGTPKAGQRGKIETDVAIDGFTPANMYKPYSPPTPKSRDVALAEQSQSTPSQIPTGSIDVAQGYSGPKSPLNAYFSNVPNTPGGNSGNGLFGNVAGTPVTPSQASLFMANRVAGLPSVGFGSTPAQSQPIQSAPQTATNTPTRDSWSIPADIQNASYSARQALGTGNGSTPMPTAKPVSQPDYSGYGQRSSAENAYGGGASRASYSQPSTGYTSSQFSGRATASSEPEFITKTITQQVPKSPAGGMSLDQATQFAYGPTAVIDSLRSAPIPTAKPAQEFETVTKQIQVPNPNYQPAPIAAPMPLAAPPVPTAKPEAPEGFFSSIAGALGGMFSPAGTAGGLIGGALGGPVGSIAGNVAGRGFANAVKNNPTIGNRGTTNSFGTGNGSGGPYEGQSWRNTSTGGTRVFNPSTRQYVDIGGSNAGGVSESQSTGKIVCTAMNKRYGFGGFRNAIWLKYAADNLTPYHERGYHAIFQPLVDFGFGGEGKARGLVRKALEHIARERTADLWAEMRGTKRRALGRSYRAILEPVCWMVGKLTPKK